ncbi:Fc.00g116080.m01.CDS01 [Cosmosporella sp. VM-42]
MGGADVYCCLCGGPLSPAWWEVEGVVEDEKSDDVEMQDIDTGGEEEDYNGEVGDGNLDDKETAKYSYDPDIIMPSGSAMGWLSDVRLIGENPNSPEPVKVYISGPAHHEDCGIFDVEPGDDPNFPADSEGTINTYSWNLGHPITVPFHRTCYRLFCIATCVAEPDKEVLYETLKGLCHSSDYGRTLNIDYGPVADFHDQYWVVERDSEYVMFSPIAIPELLTYYGNYPTLKSRSIVTKASKGDKNLDPFFHLAPEVRLLILHNLDVGSVGRLRVASGAVYNVELSNAFWNNRLHRDMPWLYDLPKPCCQKEADSLDWAKVYKELYMASRAKGDNRMMGLVNRRRIWETTFPQIVEPYLRKKLRERLASLLCSVTFTYALICEHFELPSANPALRFHWSKEGSLSDIRVVTNSSDEPNSADLLKFPVGDWMSGLVVTSREKARRKKDDPTIRRIVGLEVLYYKGESIQLGDPDGDKRLIHVTNKKFAVGIRTSCSSDGLICRIAILQQPRKKAYKLDRITEDHTRLPNLHAMKWLWRTQLPPPSLHVSEFEAGYWNHDIQGDVSPMEALVFASTEEELSDVTSIAADVQLGGFMVTYGHRPSRSIGPRLQALKTLNVDGNGGERLVSMIQVTEHIPCFIRFVTNRGRQLVVGHKEGRDVNWPPTQTSGGVPMLSGFYAWWSDRQLPQTTLGAIGCLYDPNLNSSYAQASDAFTVGKDSDNFYWEPTLPPFTLRNSGRSGVSTQRNMVGQSVKLIFLDRQVLFVG